MAIMGGHSPPAEEVLDRAADKGAAWRFSIKQQMRSPAPPPYRTPTLTDADIDDIFKDY